MMDIEIKSFCGQEILAIIEQLAHLRIQVFKDWPYLYDGNLEYERNYLKVYSHSKRSIIGLAYHDKKIIAATSGLPLIDESIEFQKPFLTSPYNMEKIFYFGESIALSDFQGSGLGKLFFQLREEHARKVIEGLEYTCFAAVERSADHPLKPKMSKSLENFWKRQGYQKNEELKMNLAWKDVDQSVETSKKLCFWFKKWTV